jgi:hypothetical protein
MDFLGLCSATRRECGLSGGGPASVKSQTGMMERVVNWVQNSYSEIQQLDEWLFRWAQGTGALKVGVSVYTGVDLGLPELGLIYRDEVYRDANLARVSWVEWPRISRAPAASDTPTCISRRPDGKIVVWPTPTIANPIRMDYQRKPHVLVENTDTPLWSDDSQQMAIVWSAVMKYAEHVDDPAAMSRGRRGYDAAIERMSTQWLQGIEGRPLTLNAIAPSRPTLG